MKYTKDEEFEEVMKRSRVFKKKHAKKVASILSGTACVLMVVLVVVISRFGGVGTDLTGESAYGSFMLPTQAGGYVLAAVISFIAGIFVAVVIQKRCNTNKE